MNDNVRKEAALKELERKIAEVESEIQKQVDIAEELDIKTKELRDNIKKMEHDADVANEKACALRYKHNALAEALRIMMEE